jgi:hypothetical protein
MPASPLAVLGPGAVMIVGEALPWLAARRAGRLRAGDPAGQVAIAWAVMDVCNLVQGAAYLAGRLEAITYATTFAGIALPLLLTPPLLTWIGPAAKRWQPAVLAGFAALTLGMVLAFGPGRESFLLSRTTAHTALAGLVLLMMATQFRRAADPHAAGAEPGWAWIAGGHLAYFLATLLGRAVIEALIARSYTVAAGATMALLLFYALTMVAISWGILVSARHRAGPGAGDAARPTPASGAPLPVA